MSSAIFTGNAFREGGTKHQMLRNQMVDQIFTISVYISSQNLNDTLFNQQNPPKIQQVIDCALIVVSKTDRFILEIGD